MAQRRGRRTGNSVRTHPGSGLTSRRSIHPAEIALFAVHGLTTAQLALAGVESVIPMDEIVEAMVRIGRARPRGQRETAEGGLAATLTGCTIGDRHKNEANERRAERERAAQERKESVGS